MAITVRLRARRQRGRIDASELVTRRAQALLEHLGKSILDGVSPVDGSPRPTKRDGKPQHFNTGRLGRKLRLGPVHRGRGRAQVEVLLPRGQPSDEHREAWVAKHPDVMTAEGRGQVVMAEASADYFDELREQK